MSEAIITLLQRWERRYSYEDTAMSQAEFARCIGELLEVSRLEGKQ